MPPPLSTFIAELRRRRVFRVAVMPSVAIILALGCGNGTDSGRPLADIPLRDYYANLTTVNLTVEGKEAKLLFDTGGGLTLITPKFARTLGLEPFGQLVVFRASGEKVLFQRAAAVSVQWGEATVLRNPAIFDLMALLNGLPEVDGIASLHTLGDLPFTLDLSAGMLIVESKSSLSARTQKMSPISVRFSRQAGGESVDLFLEVKAQQGTIWLEIDSGNATTVKLSRAAYRQLGIEPSSPSQTVSLDVVGLGPIEIEASQGDLIYDGLLNIAFLRQLILTVDMRTGKAWARAHEEL